MKAGKDVTKDNRVNAERALSPSLPPAGSHIHFIGIGGSSMSGLALIVKHYGYVVSGSDREESSATQNLRNAGIDVIIGQKASNITPDIDLVIYTVAVSQDNPELREVIDENIPYVERGRFLGMISRRYKYPVSVSGAHGKTTTTAMLSAILIDAGFNPAVHLGGVFPLINGSVRPSDSDYFVTEACEYHSHMLELSSYGAVILNVDSEHLDYYKTDENIDKAFAKFASNVSPDGFLVVCAENKRAMSAAFYTKARLVTYALAESCTGSEFEAGNIALFPDRSEYDLLHNGEFCGRIVLRAPGRHVVLNSLAAIGAAWYLGAGLNDITKALSEFTGTGRRFERKGNIRGALLIDDYAHHPEEVKATLAAARTTAGSDNRIIAIFQVHTYTRAIKFGPQFAEALKDADEIIVADIYAAREADPGTVSGKTLTDLFVSKGLNAKYISSFEDIAEYVSGILRSGDIIITLGAGNINKVLPLIK